MFTTVFFFFSLSSVQRVSPVYLLPLWRIETTTAAILIIIITTTIICHFKHNNTREDRGCFWLIKARTVTCR